jgi:hypothetical protein
MLNPYHLRSYIGHEVRIETDLSIVDGTLTDVDRRALHLVDVSIGWQEFAAMMLDVSSIRSVASERCPHNIELVVGVGLSLALGKVGVEAFTKLRDQLACWVKLPSIRARDNLSLEPYAFSVRCGRVIIAEGEARSLEELFAEIESFYSPTSSENSGDISPGLDHV